MNMTTTFSRKVYYRFIKSNTLNNINSITLVKSKSCEDFLHNKVKKIIKSKSCEDFLYNKEKKIFKSIKNIYDIDGIDDNLIKSKSCEDFIYNKEKKLFKNNSSNSLPTFFLQSSYDFEKITLDSNKDLKKSLNVCANYKQYSDNLIYINKKYNYYKFFLHSHDKRVIYNNFLGKNFNLIL